MKESRRTLYLVIAFLIALTFATFWQVLRAGFLQFDDADYVTMNPQVKAGLSLEGLAWAFTAFHSANWHPLTWISHMLDVQLFDMNPWGHHLTNLLLHIGSVLVLFAVLRRATGSTWKSAFVAALFAVHPLHVESVAWIAERKDVLSAFLLMLTLWAYVRYAESPSVGRYLTVILLFALGLMAKPMLVSVPFLLLLLDWWPLRRMSGRVGNRERTERRRKGRKEEPKLPRPRCEAARGEGRGEARACVQLLLEKVPFLVLAVGSSIVTFLAQGAVVRSLERFPLGARIENALFSYVAYVWKMVYPAKLAAFYPHMGGKLPVWQVAGAALLLLCVTVLVLRLARSRPYLTVGWLWYLLTLVPVIGFVQVAAQGMADRYTYIPLVGLFVVIAWLVPDLIAGPGLTGRRGREKERENGRAVYPEWPSCIEGRTSNAERSDSDSGPGVPPSPPRPVVWVYAMSVLALLSIASLSGLAYRQVGYWHDGVRLFKHAMSITGPNAVNTFGLGTAYEARGDWKQAAYWYERTLQGVPRYPACLKALANAYLRLDDLDRSAACYERYLEMQPEDADAQTTLGVILTRQRKYDEAIARYMKALEIEPKHVIACIDLAGALVHQGKTHEAVRWYKRALQIEPGNEDAAQGLQAALLRVGDPKAAFRVAARSLRIKPDEAGYHLYRGNLLFGQGKNEAAAREYMAALRINPNYGEAHNNLGSVLLKLGRFDEAVFHYREALRANPRNGKAHLNLAVALYAQGKYADAWNEVRLARQYGQTPAPSFLAALRARMPEP